MHSSRVTILPYHQDNRLPGTLPTTPKVRILFQKAPEASKSSSASWVYALALSALFLCAAAIKAPHGSLSKLSALPDYARYYWMGFHRTALRAKSSIKARTSVLSSARPG